VTSAIVFGYHNVGVRCLRAVLDAGVDVRLVVTHEDNPKETIWFGSVAAVTAEHGLRCITPSDPNVEAVLAECRAAQPDFLFSFYYRQMLGAPLLAVPARGAYNLHGSLLPRYRGRAPVNWAVLHGERETGATLHAMHVKPDFGAVVDQCAVPILGDDTAREVFDKVTLAAEIVVARSVPRLIDGSAVLTPQVHLPGQYFGGRKPEDGRIAASSTARQIHDLVRAVAPPDYPGAFFDAGGRRIVIARTKHTSAPGAPGDTFTLQALDGALWITAADGGRLRVLAATVAGQPLQVADVPAPIAPDV
jgi:methionyl-tRNA formyltransferase